MSFYGFHYRDNPYPADPPTTVDTCQACYEGEPDAPHTRDCELKDIHLRVNVDRMD